MSYSITAVGAPLYQKRTNKEERERRKCGRKIKKEFSALTNIYTIQ